MYWAFCLHACLFDHIFVWFEIKRELQISLSVMDDSEPLCRCWELNVSPLLRVTSALNQWTIFPAPNILNFRFNKSCLEDY